MRVFSLVVFLSISGAACATTPAPGPAGPKLGGLAALNCGQELLGFRLPHDAVEDSALAQDVRMGARWFKMRVWRVPRPAAHVRDFYKRCMGLDPSSESEEGTRHYEKGETTLSISGGKTDATIRLRFAP